MHRSQKHPAVSSAERLMVCKLVFFSCTALDILLGKSFETLGLQHDEAASSLLLLLFSLLTGNSSACKNDPILKDRTEEKIA
ncbi:hypothetical protein KUCAC02_016850, partial [Chaenocephalus aceratus]